MKIYTIQISIARQLKLAREAFLDITVKSGDNVFAPTWRMVMKSKDGKMTQEQYTEQYYDLMRESYRHNRKRWEEILQQEQVILACYCRADNFCHRYLLKDMLIKCGGEYGGEIRTMDDMKNFSFFCQKTP